MEILHQKAVKYLEQLCQIEDRAVGSPGNRAATSLFANEMEQLGWRTKTPVFDVLDWQDGPARLQINGVDFKVMASPYSAGCQATAQLVAASSIEELKQLAAKSKIIFLHGNIAREQLMPKNFIFYNPEEHQKIIALLEKSKARAIICATERNSALAGGVYPFPLLEDGDFDIPSVYMTQEEGRKLIPHLGSKAYLSSKAKRIDARACNVIAVKGNKTAPKIVITAHIDAKKGTPGALDNASGVVVLLLIAHLMQAYTGPTRIEITAFNGEDYYAVSGQMDYIAANQNQFEQIALNINIDGAGYKEGLSAFSFYQVPAGLKETADSVLNHYPGIKEGVQWVQGDHSIFVQYKRPAIAVSSAWFIENMASQEITHTRKDVPGLIDCSKLVEIARAIVEFVCKIA